MKHLFAALFLIASLTGCATADYKAYAEAQSNVAAAKASAETARYNALSKIAETGTDASKIAAVMALALGNQGAGQAQQIAAPPQNEALQWASILVPGITNIAGMALNAKVAITNAESSARVSESTNAAFLGIAGKIQAPAPATVITPVTVTPVAAATIVPQANVSTITTTTSDNHAVTTDSHASAVSTTATTTTTANPVNTTSTSIGGAGVIGNGTYSTQANPVTTTANPVTTTANPVTTTTTNTPVTTTTNPPGKTCATSAAGVVNCI